MYDDIEHGTGCPGFRGAAMTMRSCGTNEDLRWILETIEKVDNLIKVTEDVYYPASMRRHSRS